MCEANAFVIENNTEKKVLSDVDIVEFEEDRVILRNIFGEQQILTNVKFKLYSNRDRKLLFEKCLL